MKKYSTILVFILCLGFVVLVIKQFDQTSDEIACTMDAKVCEDGTSVGHMGPQCEFAPCPQPLQKKDPLIEITSPTPNQVITSPVHVMGKARGNWFFEATFPITIVNWDGLIIGEGYAQADGEWMTEEFVPFSGTISYTLSSTTPYMNGAIIFKRDNPSGLPEHDDAREIPIIFAKQIKSPSTAIPKEKMGGEGEIAQTKFFDVTGTNFAFSTKEIRVKRGDHVMIHFTSKDGFHDFVIDELNVHSEKIKTGAMTMISFTADKVGSFEYYCSIGSHRANGMVGKLIVD